MEAEKKYFDDDIIEQFGTVDGLYLNLEGKKYRILRAENHGLHVKEVRDDAEKIAE